jgi:hypothetical protein
MISQSVSKLGGQLVGLGVERKDGTFDFNWLDKPIHFMRVRGMDYRFGYYEEDGTTWHPQALRKFGNQILKFTFRTRYVTEDTVQ